MQIDFSTLLGIGGIIAAIWAIKSRNAAVTKSKDVERRIGAINEAKEVSNEVEAMDDDSVDAAANKWVRNKKR